MTKSKHYVYVVSATKEVCGNLQSAIEVAMADMYRAEKMYINSPRISAHTNNAQLSTPTITKIWGGYLVVAVRYDGIIRKRRIDVFEPYKQPQGRKQYKVDRAYAMQYKH